MSEGHEFKLIDVGRGKFNGVVRCRTSKELIKAVSQHLSSMSVAIDEEGTVFVGYGRPVGRIEPANDLARGAFSRWLG